MYYDRNIIFWQILALVFVICLLGMVWFSSVMAQVYYDIGYANCYNKLVMTNTRPMTDNNSWIIPGIKGLIIERD